MAKRFKGGIKENIVKEVDEIAQRVADDNGAQHGADFEEMKQVILDALFTSYLGETIRK